MPAIKITNKTSRPLNLALSIVVPIHFRNELLPEETWETQVGSVWFRFECREDNGSNRYSVSQSAMTLGLFGLTGASIAAVGVPLAVTSLAPIAGSSCAFLTVLASKPLIAAAATPEVLALTTWIATNLTKKTIFQIASEQGLNEEKLEKTLQDSSTILDGIKLICLSALTLDSSVEEVEKIVQDFQDHQSELEQKNDLSNKNSLLTVLTPDILDRIFKSFPSKNPHDQATPRLEPSDVKQDDTKVEQNNPRERGQSSKQSSVPPTKNMSKFQNQILKLQKLKTFKKKSEPAVDLHVAEDGNGSSSTVTLEEKDEEWEFIERAAIFKSIDYQRTLGTDDQEYTYVYSNKTVYIGFNDVYQFEWHLNRDLNSNRTFKFGLIEKSN